MVRLSRDHTRDVFTSDDVVDDLQRFYCSGKIAQTVERGNAGDIQMHLAAATWAPEQNVVFLTLAFPPLDALAEDFLKALLVRHKAAGVAPQQLLRRELEQVLRPLVDVQDAMTGIQLHHCMRCRFQGLVLGLDDLRHVDQQGIATAASTGLDSAELRQYGPRPGRKLQLQ